MAHDVFISYAHQDKMVANSICGALESRDIRCWIAPRDIRPGQNFGGAINLAISESKVLVLVFSDTSNRSDHVLNEVDLAVKHGATIIPFRLKDVVPSKDLEYYLNKRHWLDAYTEPLDHHLTTLGDELIVLLGPRNIEQSAPDLVVIGPAVASQSASVITPASPSEVSKVVQVPSPTLNLVAEPRLPVVAEVVDKSGLTPANINLEQVGLAASPVLHSGSTRPAFVVPVLIVMIVGSIAGFVLWPKGKPALGKQETSVNSKKPVNVPSKNGIPVINGNKVTLDSGKKLVNGQPIEKKPNDGLKKPEHPENKRLSDNERKRLQKEIVRYENLIQTKTLELNSAKLSGDNQKIAEFKQAKEVAEAVKVSLEKKLASDQ